MRKVGTLVRLVSINYVRGNKVVQNNLPAPSYAFGCECKMTHKRNAVLYPDVELVSKTRELGFNLSKIFENHLKQLINRSSAVSTKNNFDSADNKNVWWGCPNSPF